MNKEKNMIENIVVEAREVEGESALAVIQDLLDARIVRAIKDMGFTQLTPIQEQAIPYLLEGKDIIGQAQTGTGKTAAFGIPMLQNINPESKKLQGIVLCPTRELAIQAAEELRKLAKYMHGIKVLPIYGGQEIGRQIAGLRGVQIVVGTPGRVMDHMRRHTIKLDEVNMVVLDEADEMLNMGFREDMELILGEIPGEHQTALFSATMPQPILEITGKFQHDAELVKVAAKELTIPLVAQKYFRVKNEDKDAATVRLLEFYQPRLCLIFCNTKKKVDELTSLLKENDFQAEGLHGDLTQYQRDIAMGRFRSATTNILIATDVAARGIDVDDVEVVINYDVPQDIEYYVHRIGRTGRAGKSGQSFTLVSGREIFKIREIERICHTTIEEMQIPNTRKVMRAKAFKTLDRVSVYKDHEDLAVMKKFVEKKMAEYECDALDIAAAFLKEAIGDLGQDIAVDDFEIRKPVKDKKDRQQSRGRRGGQEFARGRFGDKRTGREQTKERREGTGNRDNAEKREGAERRSGAGKRDNAERREGAERRGGAGRRDNAEKREGAARRGDTARRGKSESKSEGGKFFGRRKERKSN